VFRGTWYLAAPAFAAIIVLVGRDANHGNWLEGMPTMDKLVGKDANHGNTRTIGWQGCQPWKLVGRDANQGQIGWQGCQPRTNWLAGMPTMDKNWLAGMPTMEIQGQLVGKDANHGQKWKYNDNWLARMPTMDKLVGRDANQGQIGWQGCQPRTKWKLVGRDANQGQKPESAAKETASPSENN
jgi:hypothetical protein